MRTADDLKLQIACSLLLDAIGWKIRNLPRFAIRAQPRTIQITAQSDDTDAIRVAIYTAGIIEVTHVPQSRLTDFFAMPQTHKPSVYILFGKGTADRAYVGQSGNQAGHRLQNHGWKRTDWYHALVITSRAIDAFNAAHARYLERYCMAMAKAAGRYPRGNCKNGDAGHIGAAMEDDCKVSFSMRPKNLRGCLGFRSFTRTGQHRLAAGDVEAPSY